MSGDDEPVMVSNPYRDEIQHARAACLAPASRLETALEAARTAMDNGAWTGSGAEDFDGELTDRTATVRQSGPDAIACFDTALSGMPEQVPSDSWYVRWRRTMF